MDYKEMRELVLRLMDLPATATDEEILAEEPKIDAEAEQMQNREGQLLGELADATLAKYGNRIAAEALPKWRAAFVANREQATALLASLPEPANMTATVSAGAAPLHTAANAAVAVANRTGAAATAGGAQPDSFEAAVKQEHVDGEPKSAAVRRAVAKWPALHAAWKNRGGGELVFG
jgi:hypothetical protein